LWSASSTSGATYTLEESTDNFATYPLNSILVSSGGSALSAAISGKTGGTYSYRVKAVSTPLADSDWTTGSNSTVVTLPTTITNPNGGEALTSSSVYAVNWVPGTNAAKFNLWYSKDNKANWISIANGVTGTSYNWTVPVVGASAPQSYFMIKTYKADGTWIGNYQSAAPFTINP
jgi:hypothetical protein